MSAQDQIRIYNNHLRLRRRIAALEILELQSGSIDPLDYDQDTSSQLRARLHRKHADAHLLILRRSTRKACLGQLQAAIDDLRVN